MTPDEKIAALRRKMADNHIAALVVPSEDPHQSEYVTDHWQARRWLTGFSGSAGVAVLTRDRAILWTDFRYWIQAAHQIAASGFELFKTGEPDVREFPEWLAATLAPGDVVAMDGRVVSRAKVKKYTKLLEEKQIRLRTDLDLVSDTWGDRPPRPATPAWDFPVKYAGRSRGYKLVAIRKEMAEKGAGAHVMASLEDIAWAFNLRGSDAENNPVNIAFALVESDTAVLFMDEAKAEAELSEILAADNIELKGYEKVFATLETLPDVASLLLDPETVSQALFDRVNPNCRIIEGESPAVRLKAVKNDTEIRHLRDTAVKDGAAKTKFLHWLETCGPDEEITEQSVAGKLLSFRKEQADFMDNSFSPIMAYEDHSAMCHYAATDETDAAIRPSGMFLTDSGGNYLTGTTDITRTVCLGSPTARQIRDYTLVLKGHIAVATALFPKGTKGFQIDTLARQFLWRQGMNFGHGTGHGVGFFLCVHEGPARISPTPVDVKLEKGMLLTNEPGVYREGQYGIRLENMILVAEAMETEFGGFMQFENLTLCHFERDLMDKELLTPPEIEWVDRYHSRVFESLSGHLPPDVRDWLKLKTRPL